MNSSKSLVTVPRRDDSTVRERPNGLKQPGRRYAFESVSGARSSHSLLIHRRFCSRMTRPRLKPSRLQPHSAPTPTTGAHRDGLYNSHYGCGNIRTPMRVWLSEALMRSRNHMESLDDYTYASWHGHNSFDDARNSGTRASSYPRARKPNDNQTLVSAGRSPPAAYCRCSHIDLRISADP